MQLDEIRSNIAARRDRIFLLMEELRRLRIQQRLKVGATTAAAGAAAGRVGSSRTAGGQVGRWGKSEGQQLQTGAPAGARLGAAAAG
jgi:hypothetical protein